MAKQTTGQALLSGMSDGSGSATEPETEPIETAVVTPEPASTPEPAVEPVAEPVAAAPSYLDRVKELGFENVANDQDAFDRLAEAYRQREQQLAQVQNEYQRAQPFVQYGQQYIQQLQNPDFARFQAQQSGRQAPAPEPAADPSKWWAPPQYDPTLISKYQEVVVDADGTKSLGWKANTPAEIRAGVESFQVQKERWADELVSNPQKALTPFKQELKHEFMNEVRQMFDQVLGSTNKQREIETFADRIRTENSEWMYENDPRTGGLLADPVSGDPVLSTQGQLATRYIQRAEQIGIQDPYEQWNYAVGMLNAYQTAQNQQQAPTPGPQMPVVTPAQVADTKKQELLARGRGANSIPSRGGSVPPIESPARKTSAQNKNLSPGEQLRTELRRAGVGV